MTHRAHFPPLVCAVLSGALVVAGCTGPDEAADLTDGAVRVFVSTTGGDVDLDAYALEVNPANGPTGGSVLYQTIDLNGTRLFSELAAGKYVIQLTGVASNCLVGAGTSRSVTVIPRDTVTVAFTVGCAATGARIIVAATGIDLDSSVSVAVDGVVSGTVAAGGSIDVTRLPPGIHTVALGDIALNCVVAGGSSRSVTVAAGQVATVSFTASCVATTGIISVSAATAGPDQDPSGYTIRVGTGSRWFLAANGSASVEPVGAGEYDVQLGNVAKNCTVDGPNPVTARVTTGGASRVTTQVMFRVACLPFWKLAFARGEPAAVVLASADGSEIEIVAGGDEPAWSPDGGTLMYSCGQICLESFRGTPPVRLGGGSDHSPAWSPNGAKIAFASSSCPYYYDCQFDGLFLMSSTGSDRSRIPIQAGLLAASGLAWSPNGDRLAFTCLLEDGNEDICVVNVDGTGGFQRLTTDPASDRSPDWKPDGSRIAFHTSRYSTNQTGNETEVAVMSPDGRGVTRLSPGTVGIDPAWSPDGSKIVFAACGVAGCVGLYMMNADGTGVTRLTTGRDRAPTWRR